MRVYGQLLKAQVENLSSDPTPGIVGRVWFNTSSGQFKYDAGSAVQVIGTLAASADSVAAAMTTTGTSSLVSTMTAANANTLINKVSSPISTVSNLILAAISQAGTDSTPNLVVSAGSATGVTATTRTFTLGRMVFVTTSCFWTQTTPNASQITLDLLLVPNDAVSFQQPLLVSVS